jgi:hypothetical protein
MVKHPLRLMAAAAAVWLGAAAPAAAGGCCPGGDAACDCGPIAAPVAVQVLTRSYVVEQGPLFSGPGHYVKQMPQAAPRKYPYVGYLRTLWSPRGPNAYPYLREVAREGRW